MNILNQSKKSTVSFWAGGLVQIFPGEVAVIPDTQRAQVDKALQNHSQLLKVVTDEERDAIEKKKKEKATLPIEKQNDFSKLSTEETAAVLGMRSGKGNALKDLSHLTDDEKALVIDIRLNQGKIKSPTTQGEQEETSGPSA
jgi:hypothetical protein